MFGFPHSFDFDYRELNSQDFAFASEVFSRRFEGLFTTDGTVGAAHIPVVPPSPSLPSDIYDTAAAKLFEQAANGRALHVGNGIFKMKSTDLTALAAGSGAWGSPEAIAIGTAIGVYSGP